MGLVTVASDIEPYREVIRSGENGLLVANSALAWYQELRRLVVNKELRERLRRSARREVVSSAAVSSVNQQRLSSLAALLEGS